MSDRIADLAREPDSALVDALEALTHQLASSVEEGENCDLLIGEFNALAGSHTYTPDMFFELDGWINERDFAKIAAKGAPPLLENLSKEELVAIAVIIESGAEPNVSFFIDLLDLNFPEAASSELFFYPHADLGNDEIADELLLRRALYDTGGGDAVRGRRIELAKQVMENPNAEPWAIQGAESILNAYEGGNAR